MKTLRYARSRRSRFNRETQFWREARERHQHKEGSYQVRPKRKKAKIEDPQKEMLNQLFNP